MITVKTEAFDWWKSESRFVLSKEIVKLSIAMWSLKKARSTRAKGTRELLQSASAVHVCNTTMIGQIEEVKPKLRFHRLSSPVHWKKCNWVTFTISPPLSLSFYLFFIIIIIKLFLWNISPPTFIPHLFTIPDHHRTISTCTENFRKKSLSLSLLLYLSFSLIFCLLFLCWFLMSFSS